MKVKILYSKQDLRETIKFISNNNENFLGQDSIINDSILNTIKKMTEDFPNSYFSGTMGYAIIAEILELESMDSDNNVVYYSFLVDPSLKKIKYLSDEELVSDTVEEIIYI